MIQVVLIHDDTLLRLFIRQILENTQDIQIMGDTDTGHEGIQCAQELQPDVVILSLTLPDISGKTVVTRLLNLPQAPKILVISLSIQQVTASPVLGIGAWGYLTPHTSPAELISAVRTVHAGEAVISDEIIRHLKSAKNSPLKTPALSEWTDREMDVLNLVTQGKTIVEIADQLSINHKTVYAYRNRIFQKLGVNNDVMLTRLAIWEGLITIDIDNN